MNVLSPLDETVRDLSLAQHLPRIKKLLVYVCTQHWETDPAGLASYHLHELIQQLLLIAPTFEELKGHLNRMVQTLSKPGEYTLVTNTILRHLQRLYSDAVPYISSRYQSLYRVAAEQLTLDPDRIRIKKLLYFVCRGQWTQDLERVELLELVAELHALTPTYPELTTIFDSVIQNVSKPEKYREISQRIIQGLAPLYHPTTQAVVSPLPALAPTPMVAAPIQATVLQQSCGQPVVNPLEQSMADPGVAQVMHRNPPPVPESPPPTPPAAPPSPKAISMRKRISLLTMDDWFTMRIEIHKFTNPLLAKYLLLMNSYADAVGNQHDSQPGQWDRLTWDALKNADLDTLLRDGLKSCRNIGEFERSLKRTIRQLNTPNQYKPVISAILRAVHPLFADCTGKESIVQRVAEPLSNMPTLAELRSPLSPASQQQPHIPHYQKDAAEKHTLLEVHQSRYHPVPPYSESETAAFASSVMSSGLEQTEGDSQFDTTDAEVTEQSQDYQPSHDPEPEETAFLGQDERFDPPQDTAFLPPQANPLASPEQTGDETIGIPTSLSHSRSPFGPFGETSTAHDSADETVAMPIP